MSAFLIDNAPVSSLAYQMLEEVPQSHLKWPRGGIYKHVSISPTVNNGKGHSGVGREEDRGGGGYC